MPGIGSSGAYKQQINKPIPSFSKYGAGSGVGGGISSNPYMGYIQPGSGNQYQQNA